MTATFLDFKQVNRAYWDVRQDKMAAWDDPAASFCGDKANTNPAPLHFSSSGGDATEVVVVDQKEEEDDNERHEAPLYDRSPSSSTAPAARLPNDDTHGNHSSDVNKRYHHDHNNNNNNNDTNNAKEGHGDHGTSNNDAVVSFFPSSPATGFPSTFKWASGFMTTGAVEMVNEKEIEPDGGPNLLPVSPHLHYPPALAASLPLDYRSERQLFQADWEALRDRLPCSPEEQASLFAKYFFTWLNPTIALASKEALEEHLFPIPRRDHRARMSGSRLSADFRQREMLDGRLLWSPYIEHVVLRPEGQAPVSVGQEDGKRDAVGRRSAGRPHDAVGGGGEHHSHALDGTAGEHQSSAPAVTVVPNEWSAVMFHGEPWVRGRLRWVGVVDCCNAPDKLYAGVEWNHQDHIPAYRQTALLLKRSSSPPCSSSSSFSKTDAMKFSPSRLSVGGEQEGVLHRGRVHGEQLFYQAAHDAPPRCSLEPVESIVLLNEMPNALRSGVRYAKGHEPSRPRTPNLMWSLLRTFRSDLLSILPGAAVQLFCFNIASPILIRWYVEFLQDDDASIGYGVLVALVFLVVKGIEPLGSNKFEQRTERTAALFRTATLSLLFEKCMTITTDSFAHAEISAGRVLTMASSDVENIKEFPIDVVHIMMAPMILVFCLGNMLYLVGWSALGGVASIALLLPVQMALVKWQEGLQKRGTAETDQRLRKTNELLSGIRVVKMMGWERNFIHSIEAARQQELYYRKWMQYAECFVSLAIDGTSISVLMIVISIHYVTGGELTPQVALPMIAMMGSLMYGLMMFPTAVNTIVKFIVSCRRVTRFLACDDAKRAVENIEAFFPGQAMSDSNGEGCKDDEKDDDDAASEPVKAGLTREEPRTPHATPPPAARFEKATIMALVSSLVVPLSARPTRVPRFLRRWVPPSSSRLPVEMQWVEGTPVPVPLSHSSPCANAERKSKDGGQAMSSENGDGEDDVEEEEDQASDAKTHRVLSARVLLKRLSLDVPRKGLTVVIGPTGSGKSVLLQSLLDAFEIAGDGGRVWATRSIAYVPQQPWIMQDSIRFNITFFDGMEVSRYDRPGVHGRSRLTTRTSTTSSAEQARLDRAVKACQLLDDLKEMPLGLESEIGERGVNLSGGQKARVSLARAVYADRDLYLLDDPLSALDAHVGDRILHEVVLCLLREKAVVLATHQLHCLPYADQVVVMKNGEVQFCGTYAAYCASSCREELEVLLPTEENQKSKTCHMSGTSGGGAPADDGMLTEDCIDDLVTSPVGPFPVELPCASGSGTAAAAAAAAGRIRDDGALRGDDHHVVAGAAASVTSAKWSATNSCTGMSRQLTGEPLEEGGAPPADASAAARGAAGAVRGWMSEEEKERGSVPVRIYRRYISSGGGAVSFALMCGTFVGFNVLFMLASAWLSLWSAKVFPSLSNGQALLVYLVLQGMCLVFAPLSKFCMFRLNLRASKEMHGALLRSVASGTLGFFDAVPLGRVLNRFSKDIYVLDDELPQHLLMLLDIGCYAATTMILALVAMPRAAVVVAVATVAFVLLLRYYARIIREVRRRGSIAESPMFSLLESLLNGGRETLCAYGKSRFVFEEALCRLDRLYSCMYVERAMDQWLNIRVEYLGGFVMFAVTCIGIFQKLRSPDGRMPGETLALISLSLTMCVDLFWSLPLIVKVSAWTEASMNSVQRITHYVEQIDREELLSCADAGEMDDDAGAVDHVDIITDGGPILGGNSGALVPPASSSMLVFEHVCMRYRAGLPYVLRDVSFRIGAREKVGIVGRTGSGKSTLLLTFMRLVEISEGCMYVLGRRATDYSLPALRRQFALIPQDPVLFEGTVRSNLDPFGKCSEAELCRVLALIGLTDAAAASATVTEEVGEREAEAEEEEPERVTPDTVVSEGGKNFSVGQRQLLCMGRALLKKGNQFVLMDEATANVDPVLDERIQRVVHTCFAPYVVVTIAHRLHTVASYDRIIVLHRGRVVEQGAPAALIEQPSSQLRQMVVRSATGPSTPPGQRDALVAEAVRKFTQRCRAVEQKNK